MAEQLTSEQVNQIIRAKLHVKRNDILPFTGWEKTISRDGLAKIFGELGFKTGAEIGVRWGGYSKMLCDSIPGVKHYCIDPYIPYEGRRPSQERMDRIFDHAKRLLAPYDATFIRKTSMQAVTDFEDGSLDYVYIDGLHHFSYVMMDIICWTPKVRIGGIVAGHDYVESYSCGVINAVRAYTQSHAINEWYLTYDPGAKEPHPSWFFVRSKNHGYLPERKLLW